MNTNRTDKVGLEFVSCIDEQTNIIVVASQNKIGNCAEAFGTDKSFVDDHELRKQINIIIIKNIQRSGDTDGNINNLNLLKNRNVFNVCLLQNQLHFTCDLMFITITSMCSLIKIIALFKL